jgi:ribosome biogenesis protein UTP30
MATKTQSAKKTKIIVANNESKKKQQKEAKDAMEVTPKEDTLDLKPHDHLNVGLVSKAVKSLLKYVHGKDQKAQLFENDDFISLIITLNKIPEKAKNYKPMPVPLAHPLHDENIEVCFFVKDPIKQYKEMFEQVGVSPKKILSPAKLKAKYNNFEARRKLLGSFDLFLCDEALSNTLPKYLGREFFKSKRYPVSIKISQTSIAKKYENILKCTFVTIPSGSCLNVRIARTTMTEQQVAENITQSINDVVAKLPKKWSNVRSISIKTSDSVALPIYNKLPDVTARLADGDTQ